MMGRKIMGETGIKPIVIEEICDLAKKYNVSAKIDDYNSSMYYENPSYLLECYLENRVIE